MAWILRKPPLGGAATHQGSTLPIAAPPIAAPPIAAPPAAARPLPLIRPFAAIRPALPAGLAAAGAQLLPSLLFLGFFFVLPAVMLFAYSFLTQSAQGTVGLPVTLEHYRHFFGTALYAHVLWTTLAISLWTTAAAALLGYPVALVMVRASALAARAITMIVIAPLIVSIVVRTYGWEIILGNGPTGVLNWLLLTTGFIHQPLRLLYTQAAVVIGSLHVFFPLMVLPLASALGKIDPSLDEAATTLGATQWRRFRRVTLPLSLPGLAVGATLGVLADRRLVCNTCHSRRHLGANVGHAGRSADPDGLRLAVRRHRGLGAGRHRAGDQHRLDAHARPAPAVARPMSSRLRGTARLAAGAGHRGDADLHPGAARGNRRDFV